MRGQPSTVAALEKQLRSKSCPHVWLLVGPSGVGKTTIARIIARELSVDDVQEIDAASNSGVEATRALVQGAQFKSLLSDRKMVILDECHTLSKQAWQPLLKILEEPPPHLYFALCTTEAWKVPETIRTRSQEYILQPASPHVLEELLDSLEETRALAPAIKGALMSFAEGSLRKLLSGAEKVYRLYNPGDMDGSVRTAKEVLRRLDSEEECPAVSLARMIASRRMNWDRAKKCLLEVADDPETARITIMNYLSVALLKCETVEKAMALGSAMNQLRIPCYEAHPSADLALSILSLLEAP
ncbi:MAG: ATP-binding protein [Bryobacteraceae bacterium]